MNEAVILTGVVGGATVLAGRARLLRAAAGPGAEERSEYVPQFDLKGDDGSLVRIDALGARIVPTASYRGAWRELDPRVRATFPTTDAGADVEVMLAAVTSGEEVAVVAERNTLTADESVAGTGGPRSRPKTRPSSLRAAVVARGPRAAELARELSQVALEDPARTRASRLGRAYAPALGLASVLAFALAVARAGNPADAAHLGSYGLVLAYCAALARMRRLERELTGRCEAPLKYRLILYPLLAAATFLAFTSAVAMNFTQFVREASWQVTLLGVAAGVGLHGARTLRHAGRSLAFVRALAEPRAPDDARARVVSGTVSACTPLVANRFASDTGRGEAVRFWIDSEGEEIAVDVARPRDITWASRMWLPPSELRHLGARMAVVEGAPVVAAGWLSTRSPERPCLEARPGAPLLLFATAPGEDPRASLRIWQRRLSRARLVLTVTVVLAVAVAVTGAVCGSLAMSSWDPFALPSYAVPD